MNMSQYIDALKAAAKELDPDNEVWNTYAPEGHRIP